MPMFKPISENEASGKVKEVFDEIKSARQITEVPNFWKMLANDPKHKYTKELIKLMPKIESII